MKNPPGKVPTNIKDCLLELPFFSKFQTEELDLLDKKLELKRFKAGQYIFKEGDQGDFMGFVVHGVLEVAKEDNAGELKHIGLIKKGFTFGEMALVDSYVRSASITAAKTSDLLLLSQQRLDDICDQHPRVGVKILQGVSRLLSLNLRRTSGALCDYLSE